MLENFIERLSGVPLAVLYPTLGILAAVENIFPPLPTDAVVAFGSFLAARGQGNPWITFLVTWLCNVAGAAGMYWTGRKYGRSVLERGFAKWIGPEAEVRLARSYKKYGIPSLFVSRFLPAVRAVVPVFAGAAKLPFLPVIFIMALASGIWYAFLTVIAFRAGSDWETLQSTIANYSRGITVLALVMVVGAGAFWWTKRRK
ncbi:MAG TPA: DedA family protein [Gemmatimonadaceae bacterium]|nr:DedA family protein [Gemmatimonadaceae bacterium]